MYIPCARLCFCGNCVSCIASHRIASHRFSFPPLYTHGTIYTPTPDPNPDPDRPIFPLALPRQYVPYQHFCLPHRSGFGCLARKMRHVSYASPCANETTSVSASASRVETV